MKVFSKTRCSLEICILFFFIFLVRTSSERETANKAQRRDKTPAQSVPTMATAKGNLKVTLAIFSGRPDPEWQVLTNDPNYAEIERLLNIARSGGFVGSFKDMPARLGYKGFLVHDATKEHANPELIIGPHTVKLQQLLLKTAPDDTVPEELRDGVSKVIGNVAAEKQGATTPTSTTKASDATHVNLKVTLAIFSGRPDPEWQLLTSDPNYAEIERLLDIARSGGFVGSFKDMPARLGYKGFLVRDATKENAKPELIIGPHTAQLQQLLLKTIPDGTLSKDLCKKISDGINSGE